MNPEWQVIIGAGIAGLMLEVYRLLRGAVVPPTSTWRAMTSVVLGLLFFLPFVWLLGLLLGWVSLKKTEWRKLSLLGVSLNLLAGAVQLLLLATR